MSETNTQAVTSVTIGDFMTKALAYLDERCPVGTGNAVSRADVAKAGGLTEESDALISSLINAGFMPGWKIRQGRDGGVCRIGEERPTSVKSDKFEKDWIAALNRCLNERVSMDPKKPTPRDEIAYALATLTNEREVLKLPNKISEALSLGLCPGFSSRRGAGIHRTSVAVEAPAVSADATTDSDAAAAEVNASAQDVSVQEITAAQNAATSDVAQEAEVKPQVSAEAAVDSTASDSTASDSTATNDVASETVAEPTAETKKARRNRK